MKLVAVAVIAIAAAAWLWQRHHHIANEKALAAVASELAGRAVGVECQGLIAALVDIERRSGDVEFPAGRPPDHMFLTRRVCKSLDRFRRSSTHPELDCLVTVDWSRWRVGTDFDSPCSARARSSAQAINTLAHEAMHLRGFLVESTTQCYAIQHDAWTTVALGGTREQGAAVASFVLAQQPAVPSEYQSSDCRGGGPLDLHPETAAFPSEDVPAPPPPQLRGPRLPDA